MNNKENRDQSGMLELLYTKHKDWVRIANSFTNNYEDAQDLVSEAYIRIWTAGKTKEEISFGNEPNRYFMWMVLSNMYKTDYRRGNSNKAIKTFPLFEEQDDTIAENYDGKKHRSFEVIMDKITDLVSTWHVQEKQLFELYFMRDLSLRKISSETGIGLSWIHNSVKAIKEKLTAELGEDVTDFFNNDFNQLLDDVA